MGNQFIDTEKLNNGDLIFILAPTPVNDSEKGYLYSAYSAIVSTIYTNPKFDCVHCGLVERNKFGLFIIDANPEQGVFKNSLNEFLFRWFSKNPNIKMIIKRVKNIERSLTQNWIKKANEFVGLKYNFNFVPSNDSFYSSEFIFKVCLDQDQKPIFKEKPISFKNEEGKSNKFLIENFMKLNMEIPEGILGLYPEDIRSDVALEEIGEIKKPQVDYEYIQIPNNEKVFNETKEKLLKINSSNIWKEFIKKMKTEPNLKCNGERIYDVNTKTYGDYHYMTIKECFEISEKIGKGFAEIGLKVTDMVYLWLNQGIDVPLLFMGIWRQGGILIPKSQNNSQSIQGMRKMLPKFAVIEETYLEKYLEDCLELKKEEMLKLEIIITVPSKVDSNENKVSKEKIKDCLTQFEKLNIKTYSLEEIKKLGSTSNIEPEIVYSDNLAMLLNSSGTSQTKPKFICLSHRTIMGSSTINSVFIKGIEEYRIIMHTSFGFASDCLDNTWAMICPNFAIGLVSEPNNKYEDLKLLKPNAMYTIPITIKKEYDEYKRLLKEGKSEEEAANYIYNERFGGSVIYINNFGAGLSEEITKWIIDKLKIKYANYYGATEVTFICAEILENTKKSANYISNKPMYVEIRLKKIEEDDQTYKTEFKNEKGESFEIMRGELLVKTDNLMVGYYKEPELTKRALDVDGYYHSGDVIEYNTINNDIKIIDRLGNMTKLASGKNIPAAYLENSLLTSFLFKQAFIYGDSDTPHLFAFVVLNFDYLKEKSSLSKEIKDILNGEEKKENQLEQNQEIKKIVLKELDEIYEREMFPIYWHFKDVVLEFKEWTSDEGLLTGTGKLIRKKLIEKYSEKISELKQKY